MQKKKQTPKTFYKKEKTCIYLLKVFVSYNATYCVGRHPSGSTSIALWDLNVTDGKMKL